MDADVRPEPSDEERQALLEVLAGDEQDPYGSAWRDAGLRESTESDEP